jgi:hypothetical protein
LGSVRLLPEIFDLLNKIKSLFSISKPATQSLSLYPKVVNERRDEENNGRKL